MMALLVTTVMVCWSEAARRLLLMRAGVTPTMPRPSQ